MWQEQIDFLNQRSFPVIAPDLLQLRSSPQQLQSERQLTMQSMAEGVTALMDEARIDRAIVCGLSMGSYVAFEFMARFPSRVRALILAGARAQGADKTEKNSREQQAQRIINDGMEFMIQTMLPKLVCAATIKEKPEIVARVREMILRGHPLDAAAAQRAMAARGNYAHTLGQVTVPTLVICGREDAVREPADGTFIQSSIPGSRLEIIAGAGHLMNMEQPARFNEIVGQFLETLSATSR